MKATLEELASMSDPTTIHRDTLKEMAPLGSATSDGYGKSASQESNQAGSFNLWEFSVGELYGCVCHRSTTEISTSQISSDANPWLTHLRAPSEPKDHVGQLTLLG